MPTGVINLLFMLHSLTYYIGLDQDRVICIGFPDLKSHICPRHFSWCTSGPDAVTMLALHCWRYISSHALGNIVSTLWALCWKIAVILPDRYNVSNVMTKTLLSLFTLLVWRWMYVCATFHFKLKKLRNMWRVCFI